MMAMATFTGCRKTGNDHIRLKFAYHPYHITEYFILMPFFKCFFRVLGKTKVESTGKELLTAIYPSCCQQFLCTDQPQFYSLLITDQVLTSVTTRHRQISGT